MVTVVKTSLDNDNEGTVYEDVYLPRVAIWGTGHLGHVLLGRIVCFIM